MTAQTRSGMGGYLLANPLLAALLTILQFLSIQDVGAGRAGGIAYLSIEGYWISHCNGETRTRLEYEGERSLSGSVYRYSSDCSAFAPEYERVSISLGNLSEGRYWVTFRAYQTVLWRGWVDIP